MNPSGGVIIGYVWDFGDGTFSNDENPFHDYGVGGSWLVKLTVHIKHGDRCCTKTIEYKIRTWECDPCKQVFSV